MTTAHRATWKAARGGLQEEGSFQLHVPSAAVSSKDAPTERALKVRATVGDDVSRGELRARVGDDTQDFIDGERIRKRARTRFSSLIDDKNSNNARDIGAQDKLGLLTHQANDDDDDDGGGGSAGEKSVNMSNRGTIGETNGDVLETNGGGVDTDSERHVEGQTDDPKISTKGDSAARAIDSSQPNNTPITAVATINNGTIAGSDNVNEEDVDEAEEEVGSEDSDDESSDEEDEAELRAEVERIRRERALERAKRQEEERQNQAAEEEDDANAERDIASSNPLLASSLLRDEEASETASIATGGGSVGFNVRRRWDDDVVFRHQARAEARHQPRFINDTIHNDFHRRFMKRYMR